MSAHETSGQLPRFRVALRGGDPDVLHACREALADLATVTSTEDDAALIEMDLVLWQMNGPPEDEIVALVAHLSRPHRALTAVLGGALSADHAVELVKCGIGDYLSQPLDATALHRKAERILLGRSHPAFDLPLFAPLVVPPEDTVYGSGREMENRRRCFRVRIPTSQEVVAHLSLPKGTVQCAIEDLSVMTDDHHGGMLLRVDRVQAYSFGVTGLRRDDEIQLGISLPGEPKAFPLKGRVVRVSVTPGLPPGVRLAIQYERPDTTHNEKLQRFWLQCQRHRAST